MDEQRNVGDDHERDGFLKADSLRNLADSGPVRFPVEGEAVLSIFVFAVRCISGDGKRKRLNRQPNFFGPKRIYYRKQNSMRSGETETAQLVRLAATGDDRAFTTLVSRFSPLVFALCLARTGDRNDAEDLAQDVLVTVHQRLAAIREPGKFPGWLRRITMNTCNAWLRKNRSRLLSDTPGAESPEPSAVLPANRDANAAVTDALKSVSEKSRAVLTLHYAAGYSYQEIAGLLALPVATVKSRLREGRQQVKRELLKAVKELLRLRLSSEELAAQVLARCGSKSCACARELLNA